LRVRKTTLQECSSEAGSYLRLIDSCITQLQTQGPSRTCIESKEKEEVLRVWGLGVACAVWVLPAVRGNVTISRYTTKKRIQFRFESVPCSLLSGGFRVSGFGGCLRRLGVEGADPDRARGVEPWRVVGLCYQLGGDKISVLSAFISLPADNKTDNSCPTEVCGSRQRCGTL